MAELYHLCSFIGIYLIGITYCRTGFTMSENDLLIYKLKKMIRMPNLEKSKRMKTERDDRITLRSARRRPVCVNSNDNGEKV